MKFTRQPDQPNAEAPRDRKLPVRQPKTVLHEPGKAHILHEDGKTVTTILAGGESEYLKQHRKEMKFGVIFAGVLATPLLWQYFDPPTHQYIGVFFFNMFANLFLVLGVASGLWMFLYSAFCYLTAGPEHRKPSTAKPGRR